MYKYFQLYVISQTTNKKEDFSWGTFRDFAIVPRFEEWSRNEETFLRRGLFSCLGPVILSCFHICFILYVQLFYCLTVFSIRYVWKLWKPTDFTLSKNNKTDKGDLQREQILHEHIWSHQATGGTRIFFAKKILFSWKTAKLYSFALSDRVGEAANISKICHIF